MFKWMIDFLSKTGFFGLFFLLFFEGNPIIGSLIPGQVILIIFGFFISLNFFNFYLTLFIGILGSFLGDIFHYYICNKFRIDVKNNIYEKSKKLCEKNSTKFIFFGKYFNYTRAFIPFIISNFDYDFRKYFFINFLATSSWVIFSLMLGIFFGKIILTNYHYFIKITLFLVFFILSFFIGLKGIKFLYKKHYRIVRKYYIINYVNLFLLTISIIFVNKVDISFNKNYLFVKLFDYTFMFSVILLLIVFFIMKKELKMVYLIATSFLFLFFYLFFVVLIFKKNHLILPYKFLIFFELILFYIYIFFAEIFRKYKRYVFLAILLINILFLVLLSFGSYDIKRIIISVILAGIFIELILLTSNFGFFDSFFVNKLKKNV